MPYCNKVYLQYGYKVYHSNGYAKYKRIQNVIEMDPWFLGKKGLVIKRWKKHFS